MKGDLEEFDSGEFEFKRAADGYREMVELVGEAVAGMEVLQSRVEDMDDAALRAAAEGDDCFCIALLRWEKRAAELADVGRKLRRALQREHARRFVQKGES